MQWYRWRLVAARTLPAAWPHSTGTETSMRCTSLSFLGLIAAANAQDLVLVDAQGAMVTADTNTLTLVRQGGGQAGMHGLATDGITLWGCANGRLLTIDRLTWATVNGAPLPDYMSLAWDAGSSALYGVRLIAPGTSQVDRIDPATGRVTAVASWHLPFAAPSALAVHQGVLFAWETMAGLVRVDPVAGTGIALGQATGIVNVQFLCSHPSGRLLAATQFGLGADFGQIDPATGRLTTLGHLAPYGFGGGVALPPARRVFGNPCDDALGRPTLLLQGSCHAGTALTVSSDFHALGTIGALILGFSTISWNGAPLPLSLDPLLGTHGCSLYVSADSMLLASAPLVPPGILTFSLALPAGTAGITFAMQNATLAPVPGSTSWSNAVEQTVLR